MKFIKKITLSFLCVFFLFTGRGMALSQSIDSLINGVMLEGKLHYGFVIPHNEEISYLLTDNIAGTEITLSTNSNARHPWESLYRFPVYGIGYNYNNFHSSEVFGKAHAVFGFFESPFYRTSTRFKVGYQIGFGVAFFTKHFDVVDNPLNLAVSSTANIYGSFDLTARYKVSPRNEVKTAIELSHYSNGKTNSPNMGLNTVTVSAAWVYSLKPSHTVVYNSKPIDYKKHLTDFVFNVGWKHDELLNTKVYKVASIVGDYNYSFTPKYAAGAGFDFFYDETLAITRAAGEFYQIDPNSEDNYQCGLHLGLRARYGNFHVIGHVGYYLHATYLKESRLYNRLGFRYSFSEHLLFNFSVKAHYAIADYLEWGVGYRF